jgi:integrase
VYLLRGANTVPTQDDTHMANISEQIVKALPAPPKGNTLHYFSGATLQGKKAPPGFAVRVTAAGTKSFVLFYRAGGKKFLPTLGRWDDNAQGGTLTVRDAIIEADKLAKAIATGRKEDPRPERTKRLQDGDKVEGETVSGLLDTFVARYVRKEAKLRTADSIASTLDRLVKPAIGKLGIYEIKRSHVSKMLAAIADDSGPAMADRVLAYVRKAFNWYEVNGHDDDFVSPVVKGMGPGSAAARDRILSDDEIRDIWAALDTADVPACYPRFIKMLLLTGTRRNEAADMHTSEIEAGNVWTIPGARYKRLPKHAGLDHVIPLPDAALALIGDKPARARAAGWFVFSTSKSGPDGEMEIDGAVAFSGFSKAKAELDKAIAAIREREGRAPMADWRLHDLRRTARTLMSRAGVAPDHAERALGHIIGGVRGTYDRYAYLDEKRQAFDALALAVSRALNPQANVTDLASHRAVQS